MTVGNAATRLHKAQAFRRAEEASRTARRDEIEKAYAVYGGGRTWNVAAEPAWRAAQEASRTAGTEYQRTYGEWQTSIRGGWDR